MAHERQRFEAQKNKLNKDYSEQIQSLQQRGQSLSETERQKQEQRLKSIREQYEREIEQAQKEHQQRIQHLRAEQERQWEGIQATHQATLKRLQQNHDSQLKGLRQYHQTSLEHQKQQFEKEMQRQKLRFVTDTQNIEAKLDDPFFQIPSGRLQVFEQPNHVVIQVRIPAHERSATRIKIDDKGITVMGSKEFKDEVREDQKTISAAQFQTFKESYPWPSHVDLSRVRRERKGEVETFIIPKLRSSGV